MQRTITLCTAAIMMLLIGCEQDDKTMGKVPGNGVPVNDSTCQPRYIETLPNKAMRQAHASKCLNRGTYRATPPREW